MSHLILVLDTYTRVSRFQNTCRILGVVFCQAISLISFFLFIVSFLLFIISFFFSYIIISIIFSVRSTILNFEIYLKICLQRAFSLSMFLSK
jgi:hypothetical protein